MIQGKDKGSWNKEITFQLSQELDQNRDSKNGFERRQTTKGLETAQKMK